MNLEKFHKVRDAHDHWENMVHTKNEINSWDDILFPLVDGEPSETQAGGTKLAIRIDYVTEKQGMPANASKTLHFNKATGPVIKALMNLFEKESKKAERAFKKFR